NRTLNLQEIPLIAMDRTLQTYRRMTPKAAAGRILALARRCRQVEGTFTLLWHPAPTRGEGQPWAAIYRKILADLSRLQ
mgnify:CR=1